MSLEIEEKIDEILQNLAQIKKKFNIVPDKEDIITNFEASLTSYEQFALNELKLGQSTIDNQKSSIRNYLVFSNGTITKDTVTQYLDSNESNSWKSNQLKALRKYTRDYLKLGNWIEEFKFNNSTKAKIKRLPDDSQLIDFLKHLPNLESQLVFLLLHNSGLRIGEVLSLKPQNINFGNNSIDASEIHEGSTKHAWMSFFTEQTAGYLQDYMKSLGTWNDETWKTIPSEKPIFLISKRTVQNSFKTASALIGFEINPHLLRSVFADRCAKSGIKDKYVDAFCGRISQGMLAKHYTDYSPEALQQEYFKAEEILALDF